jgi:dimethylamine monooxygenase subunit A
MCFTKSIDTTSVFPLEPFADLAQFALFFMAHQYFESIPHFRPYRWAAPEFQVGLQPITSDSWLIFDENYADFMRTKRLHLSLQTERYYKTSTTSLPAQRELREHVVGHLLAEHADLFDASAGALTFKPDGHSWNLKDASIEPLWQLSDFVQEDFMLLEEIDGRQTITAASNAYSSSGRLVAAVGRDIRWAHEPVPNLTTLHGSRIDRILASVHENTLCARYNWQLTPVASVFYPPDPHAANRAALESVCAQLSEDPSLAPSLLYLRVERQTLRRLPVTRAVAFSIHTSSDPLASLANDPAAQSALLALLRSYSNERLKYLEMDALRSAAMAWLESQTATRELRQ